MPSVSVVLAAKNEELHVRDAVESILSQKGVDLELVFVDDGSTDKTMDIVTGISDERLRVVQNPQSGKASAFNYGVEQSRGDWICLFAGDDIMPAGSLAQRWKAVKDVRSDKPVIGLCRLITMSDHKPSDGHVIPKNPAKGGLTGVSYLMDRAAVSQLFPVPASLPNEDTWLETGILHLDLQLVHSGVIGCQWRVHSGNSINMLVPFKDFNRKLAPRMMAYGLFLDSHGALLSDESRARLAAKVRCEKGRANGNAWQIWRSGASLVERLRALSLSNSVAYEIRRRLYGLLSGW